MSGRTRLMIAMLLMILGLLLNTNFVVSKRREMIDWGEIIPPLRLSGHSHFGRQSDGDNDKDSLCPMIRAGQRIAQPWRNQLPMVPTSIPVMPYPSLPAGRPDCNDNGPNVFIKIILNRENQSFMNKIRRSTLVNNMDSSNGEIQNFPCV
ncbi:hypothetical protein PV327_010388 [Microctonus hyperodae]|uniref:Uncharacterized protein n=1 Tax=Microctonus hyperodae TaxID=165561 RepID=A0AA39FS19_MICHY|nr:hypothetical protein PV327_010388 [Microctonus hyperodae]